MLNKWITPIESTELNEAIKNYMEYDPKGCWEIYGIYAKADDKCWKSNDGKCFYHWSRKTQNLSYFAFEVGHIEYAKGIYEAIYSLVWDGEPFVRLEGKAGRYIKILKNFTNYIKTDTYIEGNEAFIVYAGHPENIHRLERRIR